MSITILVLGGGILFFLGGGGVPILFLWARGFLGPKWVVLGGGQKFLLKSLCTFSVPYQFLFKSSEDLPLVESWVVCTACTFRGSLNHCRAYHCC